MAKATSFYYQNRFRLFMHTLGPAIKKIRESLKIPKERLASAANMTVDCWLSIERGEKDISSAALLMVCEAMHIPSPILMFLASRPDLIGTIDKQSIARLSKDLSNVFVIFSKQHSNQFDLFADVAV